MIRLKNQERKEIGFLTIKRVRKPFVICERTPRLSTNFLKCLCYIENRKVNQAKVHGSGGKSRPCRYKVGRVRNGNDGT